MAVPATLHHPLYMKWLSSWQDCRNAYDGQRAIKAEGSRYLPQLTGQTDEDYRAYKERALFFSITSKTVSALVGMVLQKPPVFKAPERMAKYGLDTFGSQITELVCSCLTEVLLTGRFGLMLDMPEGGGDPYLARYSAENIINWIVDRQGRPSRVVLQEWVYEADDGDPNAQSLEIQYRVLWINATGSYQVDIYDADYQYVKSVIPMASGKPLTEIPFILMNPVGISWDIIKPPMMDIVDINISHYRTSADLEHGRHFTGLPTPVVSGVDGSTILKIGSQTAWVLPDKDSRAYFLEFKGEGLKSLELALAEKQSQLASLSARLMDNSHKGSEATDAVRLRFMSETASLLMVVLAVEDGLNSAHKLIADVLGENSREVFLKVNREFLSMKLSAAEILALTKSYQEGAITVETYVYNLRRGDMLPNDMSDEDLVSSMAELVPRMTTGKPAADKAVPGDQSTDNKVDSGEDKPTDNQQGTDNAVHQASVIAAGEKHQATLDTLVNAITNMPVPIVNMPAINVAPPSVTVNVPEQPAPVINIAPAPVTVNMPEQKQQESAPIVLNTGTGPRVISMVRDKSGKITSAKVTEG